MTIEREDYEDESMMKRAQEVCITALAMDIAGGIMTDDNPSTDGRSAVD